MRGEKTKPEGQNQGLILAALCPVEKRIIRNWEAYNAHAMKGLRAAWDCGEGLNEIRPDYGYGTWEKHVEKKLGIPMTTAKRFMKLHQAYPEIGQIGRFETMADALYPIEIARRKEREEKNQSEQERMFGDRESLPPTAENAEDEQPFVQIKHVEPGERTENPTTIRKPSAIKSPLEIAHQRIRELEAQNKFLERKVKELKNELRAKTP